MIVDDDDFNLMVLRDNLKKYVLDCDKAENGLLAVEKVKERFSN